MITYIAHDKKSGLVVSGGLHQVAEWSRQRIANKAPKAVIAIIKCRPDAAGRVIAEITFDGGRIIESGRIIPRRDVISLSRRASNG